MTREEILKGLSILYVEDDLVVKETVGRFLRRRCREVFEAENGQIGIDIFHAHRPDIVITDIEMPVMNGMELIERVLEVDSCQTIIITTGYDDEKHKNARVKYNVIKPILNDKLLDVIIQSVMDKRGSMGG